MKEATVEPNTMRRIDYYVGIPICFFLTVLYRLQRWFGLNHLGVNDTPCNILMLELAEMGSIVVLYPTIKQIRKMYPDANLYFASFKSIKDSLKIIDDFKDDHMFVIDDRSIFKLIRDTFKFMFSARKTLIDTVINCEVFSRYGAILSYLSGAQRRVGFFRYNQEGIYIGNFLTHKVPYNHHLHMSQSYLTLAHALQEPIDRIPLGKFSTGSLKLERPHRHPIQEQKDEVWKILRQIKPGIDDRHKLVIINPNASKLISLRKWPIDYYAELVQKLLHHHDVYVAIIGVEAERSDAEYICNAVDHERTLDLTGKTTLPQLLTLFDIGHLLITNDSGPAHFAALTQIHTLVFFGPESPDIYKPLSDNCTVLYANYACSPCVSAYNQRLSPCNNNVCLQRIRVDEVYPIVKRLLEQEPERRR